MILPRSRQPNRSPAAAVLGSVVALGAAGATLSLDGDFSVVNAVAQDTKRQTRKDLSRLQKKIAARKAQARRLQAKLDQVAGEVAALRRRAVELATAVRDGQSTVTRLEATLADLSRRERHLAAGQDDRQSQLARILTMLQRIRVHPPALLAINARRPGDAVRASVVLRRLTPYLRKQVASLRAQQKALMEVRRQMAAARTSAADARRQLKEQQIKVRQVVARRAALLRATEAEQKALGREIAALARQAKNLKELMVRLETRRGKAVARAPGATATATRLKGPRPLRPRVMHMPASGIILRAFNQPGPDGERSRGLVIDARPGTTVVAPWDGQIQFAGRFKGFGRILIIRHSGGYHSVLLGLNRIDVAVNQWVLAGEPIGLVSATRATGLGSSAGLLFELRHKSRPVNPMPWLAADQQHKR